MIKPEEIVIHRKPFLFEEGKNNATSAGKNVVLLIGVLLLFFIQVKAQVIAVPQVNEICDSLVNQEQYYNMAVCSDSSLNTHPLLLLKQIDPLRKSYKIRIYRGPRYFSLTRIVGGIVCIYIIGQDQMYRIDWVKINKLKGVQEEEEVKENKLLRYYELYPPFANLTIH